MKSVVVADDKAEHLYLLESLLSSSGFEVHSATNGREGLGMVKEFIPDLIISDILMPVMDGYTFCSEVKSNPDLRHIPFIFYTATYNDPKDEEFGLSLGADRFIFKPQEPEAFIRIIESVMHEIKLSESNEIEHNGLMSYTVLKEYNEALVRKLEDKMLQAEKSAAEIKQYASKLEAEIKQRELTEELLRASEDKYRTIFENVQDVFYRISTEGIVLEISPSIKYFTDFDPEELINNSVEKIYFNPADRQNLISKIATEGELRDYLVKLRNKKGDIRFGSINARMIFDQQGQPVHIDGAIRDVTARIIAEERSRLLERAVQQSASIIIITDKNGVIEYVNPKFTEVTGYKSTEVYGKKPNILSSGYHDRVLYKNLWTRILAGQDWQGDMCNRKKNGELYWERATISPVIDDNGEIAYFVAIKEDITNEKSILEDLMAAKEKAVESDRLKTAFLQNLSHEIRTPMNGILGFTQLLIESDYDPETLKEYLSIIDTSGNRMLNIINDLVEISKIETGQIYLHEADFSVNVLLDELMAFYRPRVSETGLEMEITSRLPDSQSIVNGDKGKIYQVLSNLLNNALKFTPQGKIEFGCRTVDNHLQFFVKDTGIGVKPEKKSVIFERFIQDDMSSSRTYEGAGLGLSISKGFIEKMNGKIWVESSNGSGSEFIFTIPVKKAVMQLPYEYRNESTSNEDYSILVVEDDPINIKFITNVLNSSGYHILTAVDGHEAIGAFDKNPSVDLILMDIRIPGLTGYEAMHIIREKGYTGPIIAQTAYASAEERKKALSEGFTSFITKPYKIHELLLVIKEHLV